MVSVFAPVRQMRAEEYRRVTEVNYLGYVYGTLAALEHMPFELTMLNSTRPMVITDKGVIAAGLLKHVEAALAGSGVTA